jgi:hypothetical protein
MKQENLGSSEWRIFLRCPPGETEDEQTDETVFIAFLAQYQRLPYFSSGTLPASAALAGSAGDYHALF